MFREALLAPFLLKLLNRDNLPWVNLMLCKYGDIRQLNPARPKASAISRLLARTFKKLETGFRRVIGDGSETLLMHDPWLFDLPLSKEAYFH